MPRGSSAGLAVGACGARGGAVCAVAAFMTMAVNAVPQEGNAAGLPDTLAPLVGGAAAGEPGGTAGVCRGLAEKQGQQNREEGNWEAALHIS